MYVLKEDLSVFKRNTCVYEQTNTKLKCCVRYIYIHNLQLSPVPLSWSDSCKLLLQSQQSSSELPHKKVFLSTGSFVMQYFLNCDNRMFKNGSDTHSLPFGVLIVRKIIRRNSERWCNSIDRSLFIPPSLDRAICTLSHVTACLTRGTRANTFGVSVGALLVLWS